MPSIDRRRFLTATTAAAAAAALPAARPSPAADEDDPLGVRADFPITAERTYLNTAFAAPLPRPVREAGLEYLDDKTFRPDRRRGGEKAEEARRRFARLFGASPDEIALLYATSEGENIVTRALELAPGDNVVVDELHFVTSFVLYRRLEATRGIELRIVPEREGRARLEDFDARIDAKTRLVSVAWVSNRNGYRHDVRALSALAHDRGALVYVDGIQALGYFPTSLRDEGIDFMTAGAFKWLLASFGVAPFFVRRELLDRIAPDRYGHGQVVEERPGFHYRLETTARKFEYAALANGPVYQLEAALAYLERVGLERIEAHVLPLAAELREGLLRLGLRVWTPAGAGSPIVAFEHGRDPERLRERLEAEGVSVSFREGGRQIRAAVALFNNRADIGRLLATLEASA